jgi:GT2 family glycosyltransferase
MPKKPKVSVIVLNWNGIHYTVPCIKALKKQNYRDFEIVVVDNGSTKDNSVAVLKKIKGVKLVLNPKNLGFAGGNNSGVKAASASEYIALLNNDTIVPKSWLKEMVAGMDAHPELGEAMSKVYNRYAEKDYHFGSYGTTTHLLYLALYDFPVSEKSYVPTFSASGGAMMYRRKLAELPFDDDYFIYHEDSYFGWLLRLKGYKVGVLPKAIVYHEGEATIKDVRSMSDFFAYLGERNRMINLLIFYSPFTFLRLLPLLIITTLFTNLYDFRKIPLRLKSYAWILLHIPKILSKRSVIQKQRVVPDSKIMVYSSAKLFECRHFKNPVFRAIASALNSFSFAYCRIMGLKCVEHGRETEF